MERNLVQEGIVAPSPPLARLLVGLPVAMLLAASSAAAQLPPPERSLPAGFRVTQTVANGLQVGYQATKSQTLPKCFGVLPQEIRLGWVWQKMPGAKQFLQMVVQAPEEPTSRTGMTVVEPAGKEMVRGGSLTWRKTTVPCMGIGEKPPLVTYEAKWIGFWNDGMLTVNVENALGREAVKPWVDQVLASILGGTATPQKSAPPTRPTRRSR